MNVAIIGLFGLLLFLGLGSFAEAQLWVSVQNEQRFFGGAQIIHIVINNDYNDNDLRGISAQPDLRINAQSVQMIQVDDSRWHAYVAHKNATSAADSTVTIPGNGLDFGTICDNDNDANMLLGLFTRVDQDYFSNTEGVAFPLGGVCDATYGSEQRVMSVIRNERAPNTLQNLGQSIDVVNPKDAAQKLWPFIQLYNFNTNVTIEYDQEQLSLEYGNIDDYAFLKLDRERYPLGADIHIEITNPFFNIDPTNIDSWTWDLVGENKGHLIYRAFDSRGEPTGNNDDISASFQRLGCEDTCQLDVEFDNEAITVRKNGNGAPTLLGGSTNEGLITLVETGSNTGVFVSYDGGNVSALHVSERALRGTSINIDYVNNHSIVIGNSDATLEFDTGESWSSGIRTPVTLHDEDVNKNSKQKETLDVSDPQITIPTIITGQPLTLGNSVDIYIKDVNGVISKGDVTIDQYSARAFLSSTVTFESVIVDFGMMRQKITILSTVYNLLNYDTRSLDSQMLNIYLLVGNSPLVANDMLVFDNKIPIAMQADSRGFLEISHDTLDEIAAHKYAALEFEVSPTLQTRAVPLVVDIVSFGLGMNNSNIVNQVIRMELEETGANTGMFEGTIEYILVGQNITNPTIRSNLDITSDHAMMLVADLDEDVVLDYLDKAHDGSDKLVSSVAEPMAHTGIIFFDRDSYATSDSILVTLEDADLNTNSNTIESYSIGINNDEILVLTLNNIVWMTHNGCNAPGPDLRLVETESASGIFTGELSIPRTWCDGESNIPRNVAGTKIGIIYADHITGKNYSKNTVFELANNQSRYTPRNANESFNEGFIIMFDSIESSITNSHSAHIDITVSASIQTEFELIIQITDANNIVRQIITKNIMINSGTSRDVIDWNFDTYSDHAIELFAWSRDGIALAKYVEPIRT